MKFEITTASANRPVLLEMTYNSMVERMTGVDLKTEGTLYLNIDQVRSTTTEDIDKCLEVANKYFHTVKYRIGPSPGCFPDAYSWLHSQPTGKYFLNWEDDVVIYNGELCIQDYIDAIEGDTRGNIAQCIIGSHPGLPDLQPNSQRIYLSPSMVQTSVIQSLHKKHPIPSDWDPEFWFVTKAKEHPGEQKVLGHNGITTRYNYPIRLRDWGRSWIHERNLVREPCRTSATGGWGEYVFDKPPSYTRNRTWSKLHPPADLKTTANSAGFFSACGVTMIQIAEYINELPVEHSHYPVVDFSDCFSTYRDRNAEPKFQGVYTDLFADKISDNAVYERGIKPPPRYKIEKSHPQYELYKRHNLLTDDNIKKIYPLIGLCSRYASAYPQQPYNTKHWNEEEYLRCMYTDWSTLVDVYFTPSIEVTNIEQNLKNRYKLNVDKTVCLYYRGTDKYTEIIPTSYDEFTQNAKHLIEMDDTIEHVLIQTDAASLIDHLLLELKDMGKRLIVIEENPVSTNEIPTFQIIRDEDKLIKAQTFLATVHLMSQCKYVLTTTGNVAAYVNAYRGHPRGLIQMNNGSAPSGGAALPILNKEEIELYKY